MEEPQEGIASRPPVALGCGLLLAVVAALAVLFGTCVVFLESGANTGRVTLQMVEAYPPGTVDFIGEHNFFVSRTTDGGLLALDDLDRANQQNSSRRCRVHEISTASPLVQEAVPDLDARLSPEAEGALVVFREDCNGAIYDLAGIRLDQDGPNLERFGTDLNEARRLVVDLDTRTCTERREGALEAPIACPE